MVTQFQYPIETTLKGTIKTLPINKYCFEIKVLHELSDHMSYVKIWIQKLEYYKNILHECNLNYSIGFLLMKCIDCFDTSAIFH